MVAKAVWAVTRMLENRQALAAAAPVQVRVAVEVLAAQIGQWRWSMPCELTIICRAHRRKCTLQPEPADGVGGARVKHEPRVGEPEELCFSQRFLVRREFEYDRVVLLDELVGEVIRQQVHAST